MLLLCGRAFALAVPAQPLARVSDYAGLLSEDARSRLDAELKLAELGGGRQLAVALFPSLDGENLEDFSIRLAEAWKIGSRDHDDGVLITVFANDHRMRIEVGYGLEGQLTDQDCARIIDEYMKPNFRRNDYEAGLHQAIDAIIRLTHNQPLPARSRTLSDQLVPGIFISIFVFAFGIPVFLLFRAIFRELKRLGELGPRAYLKSVPLVNYFAVAFVAMFPIIMLAVSRPAFIILPAGTNFLERLPFLSGMLDADIWQAAIHYRAWFIPLLAFLGLMVVLLICVFVVAAAAQVAVPVLVVALLIGEAVRGKDDSAKRRYILAAVALGFGIIGSLLGALALTDGPFIPIVILSGAAILLIIAALPKPWYLWLRKKSESSGASGGYTGGSSSWSSSSSSSSSSSFSGGGGSFGGGGSSGSW